MIRLTVLVLSSWTVVSAQTLPFEEGPTTSHELADFGVFPPELAMAEQYDPCGAHAWVVPGSDLDPGIITVGLRVPIPRTYAQVTPWYGQAYAVFPLSIEIYDVQVEEQPEGGVATGQLVFPPKDSLLKDPLLILRMTAKQRGYATCLSVLP